jgi:hypothetical protein
MGCVPMVICNPPNPANQVTRKFSVKSPFSAPAENGPFSEIARQRYLEYPSVSAIGIL